MTKLHKTRYFEHQKDVPNSYTMPKEGQSVTPKEKKYLQYNATRKYTAGSRVLKAFQALGLVGVTFGFGLFNKSFRKNVQDKFTIAFHGKVIQQIAIAEGSSSERIDTLFHEKVLEADGD